MLTLIIGGARSGKSKFAQRLAASAQRVTYVATAMADQDPEMIVRIQEHRAHRPASWRTVEEPIALASAIECVAAETDTVLVDCLTVWLSNLCWCHRDETQKQVEEHVRGEVSRIANASRSYKVIIVSNETGCGIVPEHGVARAFRDTQGLLNQWAAEAADEVIFMVAGIPLYLKTAPSHDC